jgi:hypothetical protein
MDSGQLKVLHCNDANCASADESITTPDTQPDTGRYTSLALDVAGNPVIAYHYASGLDLRVLHCDDPYCAGDESGNIAAIDEAGSSGWYASLALDSAGNPVVSYQDAKHADLQILHCNDPACEGSGDLITTPDAAGIVGGDSSLALDPGGHPIVSYYDQAAGDLNVLRCDDPYCLWGGETIATADSEGNVGIQGSLALDATGNAVVSYHAYGVVDLKVLHCSGLSCAGKEPVMPSAAAPGDVDCSAIANAIDAALVLQLAASLLADLGCGQNADVTLDGQPNAIDAALVLQFAAGLISDLMP